MNIRLPIPAVVDVVTGRVLRASTYFSKRISRRRRVAREVASEILALSSRELEARLRQQRGRLRSAPLVEELIRRGGREAPRSKAEALRILEIAGRLLEALPRGIPEHGGTRGWLDLEAALHAQRGNVHRMACRFEEGHQAFRKAYFSASAGTGDAALAARVYCLHASLLTDCRHFEGALQTLGWAEALYRELEDTRQLCKVLQKRASLLSQQGEFLNAITIQIQAIEILEPEVDPPSSVAAWANLAGMYNEAGEPEVAEHVLEDSAELAAELGTDHTGYATWRWIRGRVGFALGQLKRAEDDLRWVFEFFQCASDPFNAGLAGLDVMKLYTREARLEDLVGVAGLTVELLESQVFAPEALEAVRLLGRAVERREVEARLLDQVAQAMGSQRVERAYRGGSAQ